MSKLGKKAVEDRNAAILARWNEPGAAGFFHWLADIKPRVLTGKSAYQPIELLPWQDSFIREALDPGQDQPFRHKYVLHVTPRRHSKSTCFALIVLWLFTSRQNLNIQVLGNAGEHSEKVQMRPLRGMIRNTPALRAMIAESDIQKAQILNPHMGNTIQTSNTSMSLAFGDKLACLWVSDFHACPDYGVFEAMQASLLDTEGSICLMDANTDATDGRVHMWEQRAAVDPGVYCRRIEYRDLDHYLAEAPAWIGREDVKRLQATTLPSAFDRDILGKRTAATNSLFPPELIASCVRPDMPVPFPVERLPELTGGRKYVIGGGLDRSKKLFGGDSSVWTTTLKVSSPNSLEPEYFILNQQVFPSNHARFIKKAILTDHERYNLDAVTLENYEVADLKPWVDDQGIPCEILSATNTNQNVSFVELYRIAKEGRLHFSQDLGTLQSEMGTFVYEELRDGNYRFGHSQQKFHDDTVYSLNWSVFATRAAVLSVYSLKRIVCENMRSTRSMCFLMGGEMELLCKENCRTYYEVKEMHQSYQRMRLDDEYPLPVFYENYVKLGGPRVYQGI